MPTKNKETLDSKRETNGALLTFIRAGWPPYQFSRKENSTIDQELFRQISLFVNGIFMHGCVEFSVKNFKKRLIFHFQNDRSGWPVLTFGKRPEILLIYFNFDSYLQTGMDFL